MSSHLHQLRRFRTPGVVAIDLLAWLLAFGAVAALGRLPFPNEYHHSVLIALAVGAVAGLLHISIGAVVRLHNGHAPIGSFDDAVLLTVVVAVVGAITLLADLAGGLWYRTLVALAAPVAALFAMLVARGFYRLLRDRSVGGRSAMGDLTPVVIIGAGEGGRQLVVAMLRDPRARWAPVAMVDDDPLMRHRRVRGVTVHGHVDAFVQVAQQFGARTAVLAIPSASAELVRRLSSAAAVEGIELKVLPSNADLLDPSRVAIRDIRDINVTDLLGRHQIDTDVASIAGYLADKRVLVTGAGGSIGSELCRQIAGFHPRELIMLDRDESALHSVELSIYGRALLDDDKTVLGDIRDTQFILDLFETRRPDVVFHAAALKHLPLLEKAPGEAVKTNIWGTLTILEAAAKTGVEKFVNISTDKAANPKSVLGYSKRLAEGLTAAIAQGAQGTYLSVRFGNVLGSRGSVLTAFTSQIATGGPVTVTDPRVTRYFMTIQEAVQLVIQAAAIGDDGEALVLDMGEPVSIKAVAEQLIELSGEEIAIVYTGLRPGEKMHEELFGEGEPDERPRHQLISHVQVPVFDPLSARSLDPWQDPAKVLRELQDWCGAMVQGRVRT